MEEAFNYYYERIDAYDALKKYEYYCPVCRTIS